MKMNTWFIAMLATVTMFCACDTSTKGAKNTEPTDPPKTDVTRSVLLEGHTLDVKCEKDILTTLLADNCTDDTCEWSVKGMPDGLSFSKNGDHITFSGKIPAPKCEAGSPEEYKIEIEACDSANAENCDSADLTLKVELAPAKPVETKKITVNAKDINIDCTALGYEFKGELKANVNDISGIKWEFSPALSALPAGFEYKMADTIVKVTGKLNLEQCNALSNAPVTIEAKACDAEDAGLCGTAKFTISAKMSSVILNSIVAIQVLTTGIKYDTKEDDPPKADDPGTNDAAQCKIDVKLVETNALTGTDEVTGTEAFKYGGVITYRIKDIRDKYIVNDPGSVVSRDGDTSEYTNKTWQVENDDKKWENSKLVDNPDSKDVLIIGALVYWHEGKNLGKISAKPFQETLTLTFTPIAKGPCGSVTQEPITETISVNPPSLADIFLMNINAIRVMLYSQYVDRHGKTDNSQFTLRFDVDNKEVGTTTSIRLHPGEDEGEHLEYELELSNADKVNTTRLSRINRINIRYYDEEWGWDWQANLDYLYVASPYVYFFAGYNKDYHTQVDGSKGKTETVVEIEYFETSDHPWQLRCDPEVPDTYKTLSNTYDFDLPESSSNTCGEELGNDKNVKCHKAKDGSCKGA